ncbi:MAG TPA: di-heme oxidoredictase family protein [Polyangiaceae bacterium]|nr:di-heme oxidoredictase family protein [Polyangiaceae bacterium]
MSTRRRPPRAASPHRPERALLCLALSLVVVPACSSSEGSGVQDGEDQPGGATTNDLLFGSNAFLPAAHNISYDNMRMFQTGNAFFNQAWTEAPSSNTARDGLGPLFNARSCSTCHFKDGRGRPPLDGENGLSSMLFRIGAPGTPPGEAPLSDPGYGDQLQPNGVDGVPGEGTPQIVYTSVAGQYADGEAYELLAPAYSIDAPSHGPFVDGLRISARVAPAMIGLGLLEAIPESRLRELEDPDDADGDGISGHLNVVWDVEAQQSAVGRFGWKAEQPSVRQQAAGAFVGDMGITSSIFPNQECTTAETECHAAPNGGEPEITDDLFARVVRYSELLAVPARLEFEADDVLRGKAVFSDLGCQSCHTPSHRTSDSAALEELRDQSIWPYTDLLLHDLGDALSDDRPSFGAAGSEWRTPPLWGLGHYPDVNGHDRLLHDGRARGVAEAILWHGGEAEASKQAFVELDASTRLDLIAFVESL